MRLSGAGHELSADGLVAQESGFWVWFTPRCIPSSTPTCSPTHSPPSFRAHTKQTPFLTKQILYVDSSGQSLYPILIPFPRSQSHHSQDQEWKHLLRKTVLPHSQHLLQRATLRKTRKPLSIKRLRSKCILWPSPTKLPPTWTCVLCKLHRTRT